MVDVYYQLTSLDTGLSRVTDLKEVKAFFKTMYRNDEDLMKQVLEIERGGMKHFTTEVGKGFIVKRMEVM